ncbi:hypothetical protein FEM48_Zijuj03G0037500 [Ziziphus jujuba var. spinosa]|uniref:Uncharacterized protein n=1 Tax=Ziziphus jujuba var. spinosa TaxID=714518 RepID=A0A978VMZ5_ZIZJJ|nr:hypothetical protein FEM48_Zijuj03G0037500 [Ziziphus jujuba var. spinosa]
MSEEKLLDKAVDSANEPENRVSYYKIFSFADSWDYLLIFTGTIGAVGNGISLPLMTIIFGTLVNSFGEFGNTKDVVHEVSKVEYLCISAVCIFGSVVLRYFIFA